MYLCESEGTEELEESRGLKSESVDRHVQWMTMIQTNGERVCHERVRAKSETLFSLLCLLFYTLVDFFTKKASGPFRKIV